jgi:hypothetical protein
MQNVLEPNGEKLRQYLLGILTDDIRTEVETRLLNDDQLFEELLISENELVDEYFAGRLTEGEKRQFETHFLVGPERQAKFRFGRVFNKYLESHDSTHEVTAPQMLVSASRSRATQRHGWYWPFQRPLVTVSVSAAILLVACAAYWLWSQRGGSSDSRHQVVSLSLMPGAVRSGGATQKVEIGQEVGVLQLELGLGSVDFSLYNAELLTEGKSVKVFDGLKPISKDGQHHLVFLSLTPPPGGDYQVKLYGVSASGQLQLLNNYNFRVLRN